MTRTRKQAGAYARTKGAQAERDLAQFLRRWGWESAERVEKTGYRTAERVYADQGDVTGVPGVRFQVKYYSGSPSDAQIDEWLSQTQDQAAHAGERLGVLVVRRHGKTDPGRWWAWLTVSGLAEIMDSPNQGFRPVCMRLEDLAAVLVEMMYA